MSKLKTKTRELSRDIALDILSFRSKPSPGIHLMNSHLLTRNEVLDTDYFDNQLKTLSKESTIIPFEEAVVLIKARRKSKHSLIAFTFDDGFAECYSHIAPVLEKYNGYAGFFICPNFIDGNEEYVESFLKNNVHQPSYKSPMSWDEIKDLHKRGHIIGAHTMDHIRVSEIENKKELHYQIGSCKEVIEKQIGNNCDYFAFTYGILEKDFDISHVEIAEIYYNNIFSASNYRNYFSFDNRVINRRGCEPYWKTKHIKYFLSKKISY